MKQQMGEKYVFYEHLQRYIVEKRLVLTLELSRNQYTIIHIEWVVEITVSND